MSLFKALPIPKILVPKKGIEAANRIAKDFAIFIDSVTETYNQNNGTTITSADGLTMLMQSDTTFKKLLDENPEKVAFVKKAISAKWSGQNGFKGGYRFVNPRWAKWWTHNILAPYRPDLGKAIIEHPKGEEWIKEFVVGFRDLIWGR